MQDGLPVLHQWCKCPQRHRVGAGQARIVERGQVDDQAGGEQGLLLEYTPERAGAIAAFQHPPVLRREKDLIDPRAGAVKHSQPWSPRAVNRIRDRLAFLLPPGCVFLQPVWQNIAAHELQKTKRGLQALEWHGGSGHRAIVAQAEREADRRSIHEEGKRDPVIDFCGTGCLVFQCVRITASRLRHKRATANAMTNAPACRLPAIIFPVGCTPEKLRGEEIEPEDREHWRECNPLQFR